MESYLLDILNLLGRWLHMITGIAWIGASFYFVWLDNHLLPPRKQSDTDQGVGGEVWSVHGGGMYHAQKYLSAPPQMPTHLHWFKCRNQVRVTANASEHLIVELQANLTVTTRGQ